MLALRSQYIIHVVCKYLFWYFVIKSLLRLFGVYEPLEASIGSFFKS